MINKIRDVFLRKTCFFLAAIAAMLVVSVPVTALAATLTLGDVAAKILESFSAIAKFLTASFYLLGMGFMGSAIFKFKAHKDNPTQIQVGTPIALMFVGAAFLYAPSLFASMGDTMFGQGNAVSGTIKGISTFGTT